MNTNKKLLFISVAIGLYLMLIGIGIAFPGSLSSRVIFSKKVLIPAAINTIFLKKPVFFTVMALVIGLYIYSIFLFVRIIKRQTGSNFKMLCGGIIAGILLILPVIGFLNRSVLWWVKLFTSLKFLPLIVILSGLMIYTLPPGNKKTAIFHIFVFILSYMLLGAGLELMSHRMKEWTVILAIPYYICLYTLLFKFIKGENLKWFPAFIIPFFIAGVVLFNLPEKREIVERRNIEYSIVIPSYGISQSRAIETPPEFTFNYYNLFQPDSIFFISLKKSLVPSCFIYKRLDLTPERREWVKGLLCDRRYYVSRNAKKWIYDNILSRPVEKGVVKGKIKGIIPKRVFLLRHNKKGFRWDTTYLTLFLLDAVPGDSVYIFTNVPDGKVTVGFLFQGKKPSYMGEIPIQEVRGDTVLMPQIKFYR